VRRAGLESQVFFAKNNTDYYGNTFGCHENYLVRRDIPLEKLIAACIPFFVTRQIYAGAGKVGHETGSHNGHDYQISQRAEFFEAEVGINTTTRRAIFNTRDEPHTDPQRYRRLHVIVGDTNRSEYAIALKVGTTALVVDLVEEGAAPSLELADAVGAMRTISYDPTLHAAVPLSNGSKMRAVEIQRDYYYKAAKCYRGRDPETDWVLTEWCAVLDQLEQDKLRLADRLDWVAKLRVLQEHTGGSLDCRNPELRRIDIAYHLLDPKTSLYDALVAAHRIQRLLTDEQVNQAVTKPPLDTRAAVRAACLSKFYPCIAGVEWGSVTFQKDGMVFTLSISDAYGERVEAQRKLVENCTSVEELQQALLKRSSA